MNQNPKDGHYSKFREFFARWFWLCLAIVVFGPFAIVYLSAFLGLPMPGGGFGVWFMGALTVCGIITTLDTLRSAKMHGPSELGCFIPWAAITCWWGYAFLKGVGVL